MLFRIHEFDILEKVGSGSYGDVFKAFDNKQQEFRAVKVFKDDFSSAKQCMKNPEVVVMTKIKHKNLVS